MFHPPLLRGSEEHPAPRAHCVEGKKIAGQAEADTGLPGKPGTTKDDKETEIQPVSICA